MPANHTIVINPVPEWMDIERLLGDFPWRLSTSSDGIKAEAQLDRRSASLVQARLRGLGFDGHVLTVEVFPKLPRTSVREARTLEARAMRDKTPGFERPGTRRDEEGKYSLTPESLAFQMGKDASAKVILDAGCGVGGNSIGFARAGCSVIAVEQSKSRLELARHNAALFDVADRIRFVVADATKILDDYEYDILFVDPPWGKEYDRKRTHWNDLPLLEELLKTPLPGREVWLKLPPSFDTKSLPAGEKTIRAVFGEAKGDYHRVKFVWVRLVYPSRL